MASSSYSSPSTPAVSSQSWKYHVFLSFRGEDTRTNFVDHLYTALKYKGIHTYKDDVIIPRGESIGPSLKKAIEESRIAVIVFSENYAKSPWCLSELEYIMKCKNERGQIVFPIFYRVDPSDVRKHKRKYGEAFAKYESENNEDVKSWKKALEDASNIAGWEPERIANGHESQAIKIIVDTISDSLPPITTSVNNDLVGVKDRMQHLMPKLQIGSGGKIMIGIWGVGGGGKTTLASCIYNEISSKFEGCCFIKNIREESINKNGLEKLQEKILCAVLKEKEVKLQRVEEGRDMIKDRLQHLRVLVVLDDVDDLDHLDELAGSRDWFGEGSRIIITTRDEHVLTAHKVDVIHNINLLNDKEAMKLFCKHAPRGHRRIEDYEQLSKNVVSYAGGLPLALRVLGRFLCNKEINEWRSALDRLKDYPGKNILKVLKISYDGLETLEKELFLHIACFFKGPYSWKKKSAMKILDACGFRPVIGVKVLIERGLITTLDDHFEMHDLIQEMAHYIIRMEDPDNPERRSRVWKQEDVQKICAMDATTKFDKIKALVLELYGFDVESKPYLQAIPNMKKLQWLHMEVVSWHETMYGFKAKQIWEGYKAIANMKKLRCLDMTCKTWREHTWPLPENFPPRELCCLTMDGFKTKQIWEGYKYLPNLRMIKLDRLHGMISAPNFDGLPNLETFMVYDAQSLQEIHPSFGRLEKLVFVSIDACPNLKMVPPITCSKKLETFIFSNCNCRFYFVVAQQCMENREHLEELSLSHKNMISHFRLHLFNGSLIKLDLSYCCVGDEDISSGPVWDLPKLQELNLKGNGNISGIDFRFLRAPQLKWLNVSYCYNLEELSELPSSIAVVIADDCLSLKTFGGISNCKWLWKVSLFGNNKLGFHGGYTLLHSMLEGNAKDYFISLRIKSIDIWRGRVIPWCNWVKPFTMRLPHDWYNKFSGLLVFVRTTSIEYLDVKINIKQGIDEDIQSELGQEESNETPESPGEDFQSEESNETTKSSYYNTDVGYVSFNSLRHTGCLDSTYNTISIFVENVRLTEGTCRHFRVELVPKDDPMQTEVTTDCLEFWDEKPSYRKSFTIKHESNSSIEILWSIYPQIHFLHHSQVPSSPPQLL